jgi:carbon-monoxide dehydrogenase small subunit
MKKKLIELHVNGEAHSLAVKPNDTLLDALRDHLGLVGTKEGCSVGECGACTVLMNGRAVLSCLALALDAPGMILTAKELLTRQKKPSVEQIQKAISGNFCRCTGYTKIVEAIQSASKVVKA